MKRDILVLKEKHGLRYLDARTPKLICKNVLRVLRDRLDFGCYGDGTITPLPQPPKPLPFPEFPDSKTVEEWLEASRKILDDYSWAFRCHYHEAQEAKFRQQVIAWVAAPETFRDCDARLALKTRRDHEYEGYEWEELETCADEKRE